MNSKFLQVVDLTFDNYSPPEYLRNEEINRFYNSVAKLREIHALLASAAAIASTTSIPHKLTKELEEIIEDYLKLKADFDDSKSYKPGYNFNDVSNKIESFHNQFFEARSSNSKMLLINVISNYENITIIEQRKKLEALNSRLDEKERRVDEILGKLEKPSAERVLADYALEYKTAEAKNNEMSKIWLWTGVISCFIFIALVVFSILCNWFPSKLKLDTIVNNITTSHEIVNIPVLVTKVLLVSLLIFLIAFCFRQYSIYKHLATLNQHRKNAFNSYTLFAAAIGDKDIDAKRALLMSLAKTIHEATNSGFLSLKQSEQPIIQNLGLEKIVSATGS